MKPLILGLGQDTILLAKYFESIGTDYKILARRSSGSISKAEVLGLSRQKLNLVTEINEIEMLRVRKFFDFTHIYNFAANSFVQDSHLNFEYFINNNSKILWEIFKLDVQIPEMWVFHPLSSEILNANCSITENTCDISPRNAYGAAKALEYHACKIMNRESNYAINYCILFNHESKYRPPQFFTKKIITAFQNRQSGKQQDILIYNTKSQRDWGSANEFMELIAYAGRKNISGQSVLGTGTLMSVEQFIDHCFTIENIDFQKIEENGLIRWYSGSLNIIERGRDESDETRVVAAPLDIVKHNFGEIPRISGIELVKGLMNGDM